VTDAQFSVGWTQFEETDEKELLAAVAAYPDQFSEVDCVKAAPVAEESECPLDINIGRDINGWVDAGVTASAGVAGVNIDTRPSKTRPVFLIVNLVIVTIYLFKI